MNKKVYSARLSPAAEAKIKELVGQGFTQAQVFEQSILAFALPQSATETEVYTKGSLNHSDNLVNTQTELKQALFTLTRLHEKRLLETDAVQDWCYRITKGGRQWLLRFVLLPF